VEGDGKAAGAILGFANFLLRLYADEQPRAVIVGWDTLEVTTKRHELFPTYQSGRDDDLIGQLNVLPELVAAFGFANAKARGIRGGRLPRRCGCCWGACRRRRPNGKWR
jgi:DNA polymerase-1